MAQLILVPNVLSDGPWQHVLPAKIFTVLSETRFFIVENIRTARRFLKQVNRDIDINGLTFFELNKRTAVSDIPSFLRPVSSGENIALLSEAGCPGVADPGALVVQLAHRAGIRVVPLSGPSSIILALMASGLNGQQFAFHGYLPVRGDERLRALASLEKEVQRSGQTQIFIETPYRNNPLMNDIVKHCSPEILFCIAANLTGDSEFIATRSVRLWSGCIPDLHKQPAIFLLGSSPQ
jgi:16S rRNA (cytidine1402-2'-O)-methyltransferase